MDSENNQIKKKRGRKPKEKTIEEIEKIPKKRGRKPTGKLIKLKNTEISNLKHDDNCLIAHIPINLSDIEKVTNLNTSMNDTESSINEISLENDFTNNKSNFNNKYINHLEDKITDLKDKIFKLENEKNTGDIFFGDYSVEKLESKIICIDNNKISLKNSNCLCWWCCHNFNNTPFPLPDKFYNNKYYVFGNFCSPSCACAFNIDINDHKLWERNSLILKLANELNEQKVDNYFNTSSKIGLEQTILMRNTSYSGAQFDFNIKASFNELFWFSCGYRTNKEVLAGFGVKYGRFGFVYAIDINNGPIGQFSNSSHEFGLVFYLNNTKFFNWSNDINLQYQ